MKTVGIITSVVAAGIAIAVGYAINKHERRGLKVGSKAVTPEMMGHPSWEAVVDNYVFIHNAFRNDLQRIITSCESNQFVSSELESWSDILDLHSRVEDEIIIVALTARLRELNLSGRLPREIANGSDHQSVKDIVSKALKCGDNEERLSLLKALAAELDNHLQKEEETVMPLLLEAFTKRELWALDSFIVNPKMDYAGDPKTLMAITKWWFGNVSIKEAWPLLVNFVRADNQKPMPKEAWKKFQDDIPVLQKFPLESIIS